MSLQTSTKQVSINSIDSTLFTDSEITLKKELRCETCKKLLGIDNVVIPSFEIKCVRCNSINSVLTDAERQIIVTDREGTILYINAQVEKVTGYTAEEILGQKPSLWGSQMDPSFYKKLWNDILTQKKAVAVTLQNKHKDGNVYPVVLRISPILNTEGEVEFFLGIETLTVAKT